VCVVWAVFWMWPYAADYGGNGTQADANQVVFIGLAPAAIGVLVKRIVESEP
jgi:hypothetical protein